MTRKATNFIKQYFFMLALAGMFVGFSAFKVSNANKNHQPEWYQVTISGSDPEDLSNQNIGSPIPPPTGNCQVARDSVICAIELDLNPGIDPPSTVEEALELEDLGDLEILNDAHSLFKSGN